MLQGPKLFVNFLGQPQPTTIGLGSEDNSTDLMNIEEQNAIHMHSPLQTEFFDKLIEHCNLNPPNSLSCSSCISKIFNIYNHPQLLETPNLLHNAIIDTHSKHFVYDLFQFGVRPTKGSIEAVAEFAVKHPCLEDLLLVCLEMDTHVSVKLLEKVLNRVELVEKLLDLGAKPEGTDFVEAFLHLLFDPVHNLPVIQLLLDRGMNLNQFGYSQTPLALAVSYRRLPLVKLFLRYGADPNIGAALRYAVSSGLSPLILLLVRHGLKLDTPEAIIQVTSGKDMNMFRYFLSQGVTMKNISVDGKTPANTMTTEMRQFRFVSFLFPAYLILRKGIEDIHSYCAGLPIDIIRLFIRSIIDLEFPFFHLPPEARAKLEWVTLIKNPKMSTWFTNLLNRIQFIESKDRFSYYSYANLIQFGVDLKIDKEERNCLSVQLLNTNWKFKIGFRKEHYATTWGSPSWKVNQFPQFQYGVLTCHEF